MRSCERIIEFFNSPLRHWCDGARGEAAVRDEFHGALGSVGARRCLSTFKRLCTLLFRRGRRPLMRHVRCACVGSDEAVFASFVLTAAKGPTEDAQLLAALLAEVGAVREAAEPARAVGLALSSCERRG